MPLCGTFDYVGVVPADLKLPTEWTLEDASGASAEVLGNSFIDDRLVGLRPGLALVNDRLVLTASSRDRATVASASIPVGPSFREVLRPGDMLHICRTGTADIGMSVLRNEELVVAIGAVSRVPTGDRISVDGGPGLTFDASRSEGKNFSKDDLRAEVNVAGETSTLRPGERVSMGGYCISIVRCFEWGCPGRYECVAISRDDSCPHEVAIESARRLGVLDTDTLLTYWPEGESPTGHRLDQSRSRRPWWKFW